VKAVGKQVSIMKLPRSCWLIGRLAAALVVLLAPAEAIAYNGKVIDAVTMKPIGGAFVTLSDAVVQTDLNGLFRIEGIGAKLGIRAYGHLREEIETTGSESGTQEIRLTPFTPKALYLSFFGVGSAALREPALRLIERTELNALVIDVKGDRGMITYKSSVPLAAQVGAQNIITVKDIQDLLSSLRTKGIYTIARIVVFKDNPLALAKPALAVRGRSGQIWRDRENLAWTDPFQKEVWDYNIDIAVEAARNGFDEIQFDYLRFPDARGIELSQPNTEKNRVQAISDFLIEAKKRLTPYNVFLAADIFGYVCWNPNDTAIGQKLEDMAPLVDYVCPMLYPSGFQFGIPDYRNPVAHPYEIVYLSLKRARERTGLSPDRFRPWLQAFTDYAFDRRPFRGKEIRTQITAAENFGANGWMLWNPHNIYTEDGLRSASSGSSRLTGLDWSVRRWWKRFTLLFWR
jgi:hypothetical protein